MFSTRSTFSAEAIAFTSVKEQAFEFGIVPKLHIHAGNRQIIQGKHDTHLTQNYDATAIAR